MRGHGIEWPNFVESPKKWAEYNIGIGASGWAQCEASKGQALKSKGRRSIPLYYLPKTTPPI